MITQPQSGEWHPESDDAPAKDDEELSSMIEGSKAPNDDGISVRVGVGVGFGVSVGVDVGVGVSVGVGVYDKTARIVAVAS